MCWSAGVSLGTYLFGAGAGVASYLFYRKLPNLLYLNFVHMQLLEYFMWRDQGCSGTNQTANRIALTLISLQPLCSLLSESSHLAIPRLSQLPCRLLPWSRKVFSADALRVYFIVTAASLTRHVILPDTDAFWCSGPAVPSVPDSHLKWNWLQTLDPAADWLAALAYYSTCFVPIACSGQWMTGGLYLGSWMYSMYGHAYTGGWPSIWCFLVNARALGYLAGH
jgi:hypothetical protein